MSKSKGKAPAIVPKDESVKVVIRCRPLSKTEIKNNNGMIVEMDRPAACVRVRNPANADEPPRAFTMDSVFDESFSQKDVFDGTARSIVDSCLDGYNGTIFAYVRKKKQTQHWNITHTCTPRRRRTTVGTDSWNLNIHFYMIHHTNSLNMLDSSTAL